MASQNNIDIKFLDFISGWVIDAIVSDVAMQYIPIPAPNIDNDKEVYIPE